MPAETFPNYPPCCQKVLGMLTADGKAGSRSCEKGHSVNLHTAREIERQARAKAAADKVKEAAAAKDAAAAAAAAPAAAPEAAPKA